MIVISATIDYNGSTIATVTNETKVLTTGGKWVTGNIKITDVNEAPNVTQDQEGYVVLDDGGTPQTIVNPLSITSNGTYSASSGYAFNPVVVDVSSSVGNDYWSGMMDRTIVEAIDSYGSFSKIGSYAFQNCVNLNVASFPSVTHLSMSAFGLCFSLASISFPLASSIESYVFYMCSNLTSVNLPKVKILNRGTFGYCERLSTIDCSLVTTLNGSVFTGCSNLTSISFPALTDIGYAAFSGCLTLSSFNFPLVTNIGNNAFNSCYALKSINFPMVSSIGSLAFNNCNNLMFARFPEVLSISASAFATCYSLSTLILSNSSTKGGYIANHAFRFCYNLLSLYLLASNMYSLNLTSAFYSTPISTNTTSTGGVYGSIFVPLSLYDSYISASYWSTYSERFVSLTESQVSYVMEHGTHIMS